MVVRDLPEVYTLETRPGGAGRFDESLGHHGIQLPEIERIVRVALNWPGSEIKNLPQWIRPMSKLQTMEKIVLAVAPDYPEVELNHMYVDNAAMR